MNLIGIGWTLEDARLNTAANTLDVGWRARQVVALIPGKSYKLAYRIKNRNINCSVKIGVLFRKNDGKIFRDYSKIVVGNAESIDFVMFTAPAYAEKAEVCIVTTNTRTDVMSIVLEEVDAIPIKEPTVYTAHAYPPVGYRLVFNDEFVGTELNRDKWHTRLISNEGKDDHLNDELQRYRDNNNHVVGNGSLKLVLRKVGDGYESGMIRSDATFRYGYFEARVKMPKGRGVWAAFWLNSDVSEQGVLSWPPEIDIFEFVNNGVEDKPNMLHSGVVPTKLHGRKLLSSIKGWVEATYARYFRADYNFDEKWVTIGLEWVPGIARLFIDGKQINARECHWKYPDGTDGGPAHIIFNLAMGAGWSARHGIDEHLMPMEFQIEWIRVYQK